MEGAHRAEQRARAGHKRKVVGQFGLCMQGLVHVVTVMAAADGEGFEHSKVDCAVVGR